MDKATQRISSWEGLWREEERIPNNLLLMLLVWDDTVRATVSRPGLKVSNSGFHAQLNLFPQLLTGILSEEDSCFLPCGSGKSIYDPCSGQLSRPPDHLYQSTWDSRLQLHQ